MNRRTLPSDASEDARAKALNRYGLLDEEDTQVFDDLTFMASMVCDAPIALVTLLNENLQLFKGVFGLARDPMPIEHSFCTHAMESPDQLLVITNARADQRFADNPYVHGEDQFVSYAGAPLVTDQGVPLGTICVLDKQPREWTDAQQKALRILSTQVMDHIETKQQVQELKRSKYVLESLNKQLDQFAYIISHDLKAPVRHQTSFARLIIEDYADQLDDEIVELLERIVSAGVQAQDMISDLNDYLHTVQTAFGERHQVDLQRIIDEVVRLADPPPHVRIEARAGDLKLVNGNASALRHILLNLLNNAIKFNDRTDGQISIHSYLEGDYVIISVKDNGPGLNEQERTQIFQLFGRGSQGANKPGKGLGLAIASKLAQNLGGSIELESTLGEGADFKVRLPRR